MEDELRGRLLRRQQLSSTSPQVGLFGLFQLEYFLGMWPKRTLKLAVLVSHSPVQLHCPWSKPDSDGGEEV